MKGKKVYALLIEKNWHKEEEYSDVLDIYTNKKDAIDALRETSLDFAQEVQDDFDEDIFTHENYSVINDDTHFQCIDEGMGYNFELFVIEKILQ